MQPGQSSGLGDVVDVRSGVRLEVGRGGDDVGGPDHPAHAPAGHRIGLRDAVDDNAALGQLGHPGDDGRELDVAVHEQLVDLVGDDPEVVVGCPAPDGVDLLAPVDGAGRVLRRREEQDLRARRARRFQLLDGGAEAGGLVGLDGHREAAGEADGLGIRHPVRRREQHLVAGIEEGGEGVVERLLGAVGHQHLPRSPAVLSAIAVRSSGSPAVGV